MSIRPEIEVHVRKVLHHYVQLSADFYAFDFKMRLKQQQATSNGLMKDLIDALASLSGKVQALSDRAIDAGPPMWGSNSKRL